MYTDINILHIGDFHFYCNNDFKEKLDLQLSIENQILKSYLKSLNKLFHKDKLNIIIISGDIFDWNSLCKKWKRTEVGKIIKSCASCFEVLDDNCQIFFCSGNHDFSDYWNGASDKTKIKNKKFRTLDILANEINEVKPSLVKSFNENVEFTNFYVGTFNVKIPFIISEGDQNDKCLKINSINSSWKCKDGKREFKKLTTSMHKSNYNKNSSKADFVISVMHHPLFYLYDTEFTNKKKYFSFKNAYEDSDLMLCGHEHYTHAESKYFSKMLICNSSKYNLMPYHQFMYVVQINLKYDVSSQRYVEKVHQVKMNDYSVREWPIYKYSQQNHELIDTEIELKQLIPRNSLSVKIINKNLFNINWKDFYNFKVTELGLSNIFLKILASVNENINCKKSPRSIKINFTDAVNTFKYSPKIDDENFKHFHQFMSTGSINYFLNYSTRSFSERCSYNKEIANNKVYKIISPYPPIFNSMVAYFFICCAKGKGIEEPKFIIENV